MYGWLRGTRRIPTTYPAPAGRQLLSWDEPFDNFGILGYEIYQDDALLGTVPTPAFELFNYSADSAYKVRAFDASQNFGAFSPFLNTTTSVWNGNDPTSGIPGNGTSWGDPTNWTRDGIPDAGFAAGDRVIFGGGSTQPTIDLQGDRIVSSVLFEADYTLQNNRLQVDLGQVSVRAGVTATISSRLSSGVTIQKLGPGTLNITGFADAIEVNEGTFGGTGRADSLTVRDGGTFAPGRPTGNMIVTTNLLLIPWQHFAFRLAAARSLDESRRLATPSRMVSWKWTWSIWERVPSCRIGDSFVIVTALGELAGTFDTSRLEIPGIGLGWSVNYDDNAVRCCWRWSVLPITTTMECSIVRTLQLITGRDPRWLDDLRFDVNGDRVIDAVDFRDWVTGAKGTILGDANLDFVVDVTDFNVWNTDELTSGSGYCDGDFTGDGIVDVLRFQYLEQSQFTSAIPVAVPEPGTGLVMPVRVWRGSSVAEDDRQPPSRVQRIDPVDRRDPQGIVRRRRQGTPPVAADPTVDMRGLAPFPRSLFSQPSANEHRHRRPACDPGRSESTFLPR